MANGIFMGIALILTIIYFTQVRNLDIYRTLVLILLFAIVLGVHGISHLLLEKEYLFVPFNLWKLPQHT
jgi:uncharacterized membrane protein HdeD (DUF308 family)